MIEIHIARQSATGQGYNFRVGEVPVENIAYLEEASFDEKSNGAATRIHLKSPAEVLLVSERRDFLEAKRIDEGKTTSFGKTLINETLPQDNR